MTCKEKNLRMMKGRNIKIFNNGDYIQKNTQFFTKRIVYGIILNVKHLLN